MTLLGLHHWISRIRHFLSVGNRKNLNSPLCDAKDVFTLTFLHIEEEDDAFSSTAEVYN